MLACGDGNTASHRQQGAQLRPNKADTRFNLGIVKWQGKKDGPGDVAAWDKLLAANPPKQVVKTLIDTFRYPRLGPGMMWEICAEKVRRMGSEVLLGRSVRGCYWDAAAHRWAVIAGTPDGGVEGYRAEHLVSSMPIRQLVSQIEPRLPEAALDEGNALRYRDFLTIGLILRERNRFNDNWIYIHDPNVKVGRVQNYKSWSPEMVPDANFWSYGLEYFCFEGDGLWTSRDEDLKVLATREIAQIGLGAADDVVDGCVIRQAKAYPVYDDDYRKHVDVIRKALAANCPNLHLVGRNGMHKYNTGSRDDDGVAGGTQYPGR